MGKVLWTLLLPLWVALVVIQGLLALSATVFGLLAICFGGTVRMSIKYMWGEKKAPTVPDPSKVEF